MTASCTKLVLKQGLTGQLDKKGDLGLPRNREISSKNPAGLNTQMVEHSDGAQGLQDTLSGFITPLGWPKNEFQSREPASSLLHAFPKKLKSEDKEHSRQLQRASPLCLENLYSSPKVTTSRKFSLIIPGGKP